MSVPRIRNRLLVVAALLISVTAAAFAGLAYFAERRALLNGIDEQLRVAAELARAVVGPTYHDTIVASGSVSPGAFRATVDRNNDLCRTLGLQYLWAVLKTDQGIRFTSATSPGLDTRQGGHAGFFDLHRDPAAFDTVFRTMSVDYSSFENEWGHGRMVLVPGLDAQGRPFAFGASVSTQEVHHRLADSLRWSALTGGAILVLGLLFSFRIARRLDEEATHRLHAEHALARQRDHLEEIVASRTAALRRSNRDLEEFAAVASHDLKEPLRSIQGFTQLIARECEGKISDDVDEYLRFVVGGAERMRRLIDDLLLFARVDTQGKPFAPVDTRDLVQQVCASLKATIDEAGAQVRVGELPEVSGDGSQLLAVFQNLIANAIKFRGEAAPEVHVDCQRDVLEWRFEVRDKGIGIEPRHHERIFGMFQRLHGREEYAGTGIGLAFVKRVVERHGGRVGVESTPGEGSTFWFTLPLRPLADLGVDVAPGGQPLD